MRTVKTIHSVTIGSAFWVGAVLSALLFAVFGFFLVLLPGIFGASLLGGVKGGPVLGVLAYVIGTVVYGVFGGIIGAVEAFLYNLVAGVVGGLEIDID